MYSIMLSPFFSPSPFFLPPHVSLSSSLSLSFFFFRAQDRIFFFCCCLDSTPDLFSQHRLFFSSPRIDNTVDDIIALSPDIETM